MNPYVCACGKSFEDVALFGDHYRDCERNMPPAMLMFMDRPDGQVDIQLVVNPVPSKKHPTTTAQTQAAHVYEMIQKMIRVNRPAANG